MTFRESVALLLKLKSLLMFESDSLPRRRQTRSLVDAGMGDMRVDAVREEDAEAQILGKEANQ